MKEWEIRVKEHEKWVSIGIFNKMQAQETVLEYMKTNFSVMLVPIVKEKICVNCVKGIKDKEALGLTCHEEVVETAKKKIADLEAKLAESEKENRDLEDDHNKLIDQYNNQYNDLCKEIKFHSSARERFVERVKELEQQLAEKEKEIENMKASSDKNIEYIIEFASLIENEKDCNRMLKAIDRVKKGKKYIIDKQHQDKISFAVEQLEKVKELLMNGEKRDTTRNIKAKVINVYRVCDNIDNQIEELKKEMK